MHTQHLAEVLSELKPRKLPGNGAEKRRSIRVRVEATVTIWLVKEGLPGGPMKVLTRDLSSSGIGLLVAGKEPPTGQFIVQLPRGKSGPVWLLGRIMFARLAADDLYVVGAEFVHVLTPTKKETAKPERKADQMEAAQLAALCGKVEELAAAGARG